jgi:hypothetical protein
VAGGSNGGINGFNAIEDGGKVKRGIKGEMMAERVTARAVSKGGAGQRGVARGDEEKWQRRPEWGRGWS